MLTTLVMESGALTLLRERIVGLRFIPREGSLVGMVRLFVGRMATSGFATLFLLWHMRLDVREPIPARWFALPSAERQAAMWKQAKRIVIHRGSAYLYFYATEPPWGHSSSFALKIILWWILCTEGAILDAIDAYLDIYDWLERRVENHRARDWRFEDLRDGNWRAWDWNILRLGI